MDQEEEFKCRKKSNFRTPANPKIENYNYRASTTVNQKMNRNKNFKPKRGMDLAQKVARRIEEEPSDEELLPQALHYIECNDKDLNDVFNMTAEELMKRPVLYIK